MGVGFWGRQAIFELLQFNDNLRDALMTTKTIHDIRKAAGEFTYQTLLESGYKKVIEGITTIEEVERVAARE
jgi:type II secretory ATPase GspE/PulE/Tfp pilus assembly ATPase PilB-like protein